MYFNIYCPAQCDFGACVGGGGGYYRPAPVNGQREL